MHAALVTHLRKAHVERLQRRSTISQWEREVPCIHAVVGLLTLSRMVVDATPPRTTESLHAEHADFVWRTLQRLGVRDVDLEDQLQEVFLVVHRRLSSFDPSVKPTTWLYGICLRVASAWRRRAFRRHELSDEGAQAEARSSEAPGADEMIALQQAQSLLERALDALDLERRAVFVMFEIEGLSCATIAEMTGAPLGTIYTRLGAARREVEQFVTRMRARGVTP